MDSSNIFNFSHLPLAKENSNTCCRYLIPPCSNFVDFELVPDEKSAASTNAQSNPRETLSKKTPAPLHPPPIISRSKVFS